MRMAASRAKRIMAAALLIAAVPLPMASRAAPSLDFDFFKARVQPIFLQKRDGHTRCYVCHAESNNAFRLELLAPGASAWTEEQSRKNFEMAAILVNPGDPATSRLLQQPLAPEVGGNVFHSGGRQFGSKDDPNWKIPADRGNGGKPHRRGSGPSCAQDGRAGRWWARKTMPLRPRRSASDATTGAGS